jgi:hypothetical protein
MAPLFGTEIFKVVGADVFIQAVSQNGPGKWLDQWLDLGTRVNSFGKREKKSWHHKGMLARFSSQVCGSNLHWRTLHI